MSRSLTSLLPLMEKRCMPQQRTLQKNARTSIGSLTSWSKNVPFIDDS